MVEEKKTEEKKLTEPKIGKPEQYKDVFLKCEKSPGILDTVKDFDELRIKSIKAEYARLEKEKHPTKYHYRAQKASQSLEQQLGYFVGKTKYPGKFDDMGIEDQISMYTQMGVKAMDDLIDPSDRD